MDQYIITYDGAMLYLDMVELVALIKEHGGEELKMYVPRFEELLTPKQ